MRAQSLLLSSYKSYSIIMGYPKSSFMRIADTAEVPAGKMKMMKIKDEKILIVNVDNNFYAVANPCTHKGGDLSKGSLEGKILTCPVHGSRFDVTTGKNVYAPKQFMSKSNVGDLKKYELMVEGNSILIYQRSSWGV